MALANVALTDTFDYWRTVTNSMVVAINDKLVFCNTSNANTVSIPSFVSRSSNLYVNIITSTSFNDTATGNVASAFTANSVHGAALAYVQAANSNAFISIAGANAWSNTVSYAGNAYTVSVGASSNSWANTVGVAGNNWTNTVGSSANSYATVMNAAGNSYAQQVGTAGNNYTNFVGSSANSYGNYVGSSGNSYATTTFSPKISPTFTGTVTINANIANQTLTDAATINWDVSAGSVATITLGGNRTMAAPSNLKIGTYILHIIQDGAGGRTITWNSVFKWPAGVAPVLTTTAGRRDLFSFVCDGTNLYGSYLPDVR